MSISKKTSWLTIAALLVPTSIGLIGSSAAQAAASSTNLSTFTVNGDNALAASSLNLDVSTLTASAGGYSVDVVATAADSLNTSVSWVGDTGLHLGANTLTVTVTDTDTEAPIDATTFTRTLNVLNNDTSAVIVVNQEELTNGDGIETDYGTTSVPVVVTPTDPKATVAVNGISAAVVNGVASTTATGLTTGDNTVSVRITAPNGEFDESLLTVTVNANTDTSAVITVDGVIAEDGGTVELGYFNTNPEIEVVTNDYEATYDIDGGIDLVTGANPLAVYVTAADGTTIYRYDITLMVSDTTASIKINGDQVDSGDQIDVDYDVTSVPVVVELADEDASYVISGNENLRVGLNNVTVVVTSSDFTKSQTYRFDVTRAKNPDTSLKTFTFNGQTVTNGATVSSTNVKNTLVVATTDPDATFAVDTDSYNPATGAIVLESGSQDVTVTVTAADESTLDYVLHVSVNLDLTLKTFKLNGQTVSADSSVTTWTSVNSFTLETNDPTSKVSVDGATYNAVNNTLTLEPGQNDVIVTVTGNDDVTDREYPLSIGFYSVNIAWDANKDGQDMNENGLVNVPGNTEMVDVSVVAPWDGWSYTVEGDKDLDFGDNTVFVTFTSEDNSVVETKSFTVHVQDADLRLSELTVNEEDALLTGRVSLADHPATAIVAVTPVDERSTWVIDGGESLNVGQNTITVLVTGADKKTRLYTVTVNVLASDEVGIDAFTVNGYALDADAEAPLEVPAGELTYFVDTTDPNATATVTFAPTANTPGGWFNLQNHTGSGYLTATVVVTAENGIAHDSATYNILASKDFDVTSGSNPVTDTLRVGTYAKSNPATVASWFDAGAKLSYSWLNNDDAIINASTSRLLLTPEYYSTEDSPVVIRPVVSGKLNGATVSFIGQPLEVSLGIIGLSADPRVTGKAQIGNTLTATSKKWSEGVTVNFQLYKNDVAVGEPSDEGTFSLTSQNVIQGDRIKIAAIGTADGYETLTRFSQAFVVAKGVLKIATKPSLTVPETGYVVGNKLTVDPGSSSYVNDAGEDLVTPEIQWLRNGVAINGETDLDYTITEADAAKKLSVIVTFSDYNFISVSATLKGQSVKLGTLTQPDDAQIALEAGKLVAYGGYGVTATTKKYIWYRDGRAVLGQNTSSYTLTSKDAGAKITVRVTATYKGYKPTVTINTENPHQN